MERVVIAALDNYDWEEIFKYNQPQVVMGGDCSAAPFTRDDVVEVLKMVEGENDGPPWLGLFRLRDERFLYIEAGCDYTGWG